MTTILKSKTDVLFQSANDFVNKLKNPLIIYSKSSIKNLSLNDNFKKIKLCELSKDFNEINKQLINFENYSEIVAVGGGSIIDVGKYIAYNLNINLYVVMTMLSTNAFSTNKVCLFDGKQKKTLQAKLPEVIIFDNDLLARADNYNLLGIIDVLSIHTALKDWQIADFYKKEQITPMFDRAQKLLNETLDFCLNNSNEDMLKRNKKMFDYICEAGYITNDYGSGRPESGSEHILAKEIEYQLPYVPHGVAVANSIILMSTLQDNSSNKINKLINKLNLLSLNKKFGVTDEIILNALKNLKPREDRFSIVDLHAPLSEEKIQLLMNKYKESICVNY